MNTRYCPKCKKEKDISEFYERKKYRWESEKYHSHCKDCSKLRQREYYLKNRDIFILKANEYKKRKGDDFLKRRTELRLERRKDAINAYGGKCSCCGEPTIEFLAIDHINGGGNKHIKSIGGPSNLTYWLRKNNYPAGFQVLCHNCNMAKSIYGKCPHQNK